MEPKWPLGWGVGVIFSFFFLSFLYLMSAVYERFLAMVKKIYLSIEAQWDFVVQSLP